MWRAFPALLCLLLASISGAQRFEHRWTRTDNSSPVYGLFVKAGADGSCYAAYVNNNNIRITKLLRDGIQAWSRTVTSTVDGPLMQLKKMVLTNFGVCVVGEESSTQSFDTSTVITGYSFSGESLGYHKFALASRCYAADMAADESGNLYVLGSISTNGPLNHSTYILKYDHNLARFWQRLYPPVGGSPPNLGDIRVGSSEIYYTQSVPSSNGSTFKLHKLDSSGNPVWNRTYDLDDSNGPIGLGVDSLGKPIAHVRGVTGTNHRTSTLKWNRDGSQLWASIHTYVASTTLWGKEELIVQDANSVYVSGTGTFSGTQRGFVRSLDGDTGAVEWTNTFTDMALPPRSLESMATGGFGRLYVAGTSGTGDSRAFRMIKLNQDTGVVMWSASYTGDSEASGEIPYGIDSNFEGDVYTIGISNTAVPPMRIVYLEQGPTGDYPLYRFKNNFTSSVPAARGLLSWNNHYVSTNAVLTVVDQPNNGTISIEQDGAFVYAPSAGFTGNDLFSYRITRGDLTSPLMLATVRVGSVGVLNNFTVTPSSIPSGGSASLNVNLTTQAGTLDNVVSINDNSSAIFAPTGVFFNAGETSKSVSFNTAKLLSNATRTITATHGAISKSATLTLLGGEANFDFIAPPILTLVGGTATTGTVHLDRTAPAGGVVVNLTDDSSAITVPASVTIPAGATSASFTIGTSAVSQVATRKITATALGGSDFTTVVLTPVPSLVSFSLQPASVKGGQNTTGTAILSTNQQEALSLTLTDNSSAIMTPATMTVLTGRDNGRITIGTTPVGATYTRTVTASLRGVIKTASLTLTP